jgi:CubicO group peptidase (beta-lactamase class C family)
MKLFKIMIGGLITLCAAVLLLILVLWMKPPDLLRVGANYTAKIVCSNVFLAGRDPQEVLRTDVQAPGIALLRLMRISVDRERHIVRAGLLGFIGDGLAVSRPGVGCAAVPDGHLEFALHVGIPALGARIAARASPAPSSGNVATNPALDHLLNDDTLTGPGMRAVVVVDHGRLVAERYAPGFSASTPLLGWSMTKSVVAGLVGMLIKDGRLTLDQSAGWTNDMGGRDRIRIADLLSMTSGLSWNEAYGAVSDVTRMLYLQADMAGFARDKPAAHPVGEFWSYSSGTANIVSRLVQDAAGSLGAAYPVTRLFTPLGMSSATMETDEDGTLVGSSYMYATARDWGKYGMLLAQDGMWQGQELLPRGYAALMATPVTASRGEYGHGFVWLWGSDATTPDTNPDAAFGIPSDCFWMEGHDGQSIAVIPSRQLVVVRLGLTPVSEHYSPQALVAAALNASR